MNEEIVTFTNWTTEDFIAVWGGQERLIKAGETINEIKGIADTFAYHLAVRELNKERGDKEMASFIQEYKNRAINQHKEENSEAENSEAENSEAENSEAENNKAENAEEVVEHSESVLDEVVIDVSPKKRGRKAKVDKEEVFEGLED
jgi:hypothetical protein